MKVQRLPFSLSSSAVLLAMYIAAVILLWAIAGSGEALRRAVAEGIILAAWIAAVAWILGRQTHSVPDLRVRRPRLELILAMAGLLPLALGAYFRHTNPNSGWQLLGLVMYLLPVVVAVALRYSPGDFGLRWPPLRAWLAVLAIIGLNLLLGLTLGWLLPESEITIPAGQGLLEGLRNVGDVLALLVQLLLNAAMPEELFFRVFLQTRLERFVPVGWAILLQALLFSAVHFPQHLLTFGYSFPHALADVLIITNGVIGGVLWWKTRSLPLLLVLHIFAYPRFGL